MLLAAISIGARPNGQATNREVYQAIESLGDLSEQQLRPSYGREHRYRRGVRSDISKLRINGDLKAISVGSNVITQQGRERLQMEFPPPRAARSSAQPPTGPAGNGNSVRTPAPDSGSASAWTELLLEESYYRDSPARLKIIIPKHKKLSNSFRDWLDSAHRIRSLREQQWVDLRFRLHDRAVIAELKICDGIGTKKSIREALGQLLEYNHYPERTQAKSWLIVIDDEPTQADMTKTSSRGCAT